VSATEISVRMGEAASSRTRGESLVSIGLGSCIGLALVDRRRGVTALAHVMLPESGAADGPVGKYADLAVPALIDDVVKLGAQPSSLEAVLVGGAQMFSFGSGPSRLDIGARNDAAVREALAAKRIRVTAAATGGTKGRTIRVHVAGVTVTAKEAGGAEEVLLSAESRARREVAAAA
jgi:chemotaxis protein CheD